MRNKIYLSHSATCVLFYRTEYQISSNMEIMQMIAIKLRIIIWFVGEQIQFYNFPSYFHWHIDDDKESPYVFSIHLGLRKINAKKSHRITTKMYDKKQFLWPSALNRINYNLIFFHLRHDFAMKMAYFANHSCGKSVQQTSKQTNKLVCNIVHTTKRWYCDPSLFVCLFIHFNSLLFTVETFLLNFRWNIEKCLIEV